MSDKIEKLTRRERIALWFIILALDTIGAFKYKHEWEKISEDLRKELRDE